MSTLTPHQLPSPILEVSENTSPVSGENPFSVLSSPPLQSSQEGLNRPASAGSESLHSHSSTSSNEVVVVESTREGEDEEVVVEKIEKEEKETEKEEQEEKVEEETQKQEQQEEAQKEEETEKEEEVKEEKEAKEKKEKEEENEREEEKPEEDKNSQGTEPPKDQQHNTGTQSRTLTVSTTTQTWGKTIPFVATEEKEQEQVQEERIDGSEITPLTILEPKAIHTSEKPIASSTAEVAAHATEKLTSRLPEYLAMANSFISRFNKLTSTSTGTDRLLMTTSYSLTALTSQLDRISHYRALAHAKGSNQKGTIFPLGLLRYLIFARQSDSSHLFAFSARLKALASLISDVRIFMRLWGLFGMYEWLVTTLRNPPNDMTIRKITYLQIVVNIFYQILENLAYLGQHKILPIGKKKQSSYWLWSSRFWMAHVVLEFWRLKRDREVNMSLRGKGKEKIVDKKSVEEEDQQPKWYDVAGVLKSEGKKSVWLKQLWSNMAYAPLTVHWSLEKGALSQYSVGTLGAIAGIIGLHQAWRRAGKS